MELDGYCASLKIAFEHHGEQHYSENSIYARGPNFLAKRKKDDLLKEKLCKEKGIHLIVIPEIPKRTSLEELKPLIKNQLSAYGISIPVNFDEIAVDLKEAYSTPEFTRQYKLLTDIANSRVGQCLSKTYKGNHTRLQWKCNVCGISWLATPASIKSGSWCPKCSSKKGTEKRKHPIEMMKHIAEKRGGKCLSAEYINANSKLKWKCGNGHELFATPHSVKNDKTWCPDCGGTKKLNIEEMHKLASSNRGKCLSNTYINNKTKLLWQCAEGHQWEAIPANIKRGRWCPYCHREGKK